MMPKIIIVEYGTSHSHSQPPHLEKCLLIIIKKSLKDFFSLNSFNLSQQQYQPTTHDRIFKFIRINEQQQPQNLSS